MFSVGRVRVMINRLPFGGLARRTGSGWGAILAESRRSSGGDHRPRAARRGIALMNANGNHRYRLLTVGDVMDGARGGSRVAGGFMASSLSKPLQLLPRGAYDRRGNHRDPRDPLRRSCPRGGSGMVGQSGSRPRAGILTVWSAMVDDPQTRSSDPRVSVAFLQRKCGSLPNFTVIPAECPVGGSQLMIICPYPFCNAGWKSGLGRPVVLAQRSSLLREGRGKCR